MCDGHSYHRLLHRRGRAVLQKRHDLVDDVILLAIVNIRPAVGKFARVKGKSIRSTPVKLLANTCISSIYIYSVHYILFTVHLANDSVLKELRVV